MSPSEQANIPWDLIAADLTTSASASQAEALLEWRQAATQHEKWYQELVKIWNHSQAQLTEYDFDSQQDWPKVAAQLALPILGRSRPLWRTSTFAWAAMITLLVGLSVAFWIFLQPPAISWQKVMATNAKQTVLLPDGSEVILRRGSSLQYPDRFEEDRPVKLEGEAWFEIAKDPNRPFQIQGPKLRVRVLGTSFSVRDFDGDSIAQVDVAEGLVRVVAEDSLQLAAGQSARLAADKLTEIPQNPNYDAWQRGELRFDSATLAEVLESLERYYQASLAVRGSPGDARLTARFTDESLTEVLEVVRLIFQVEVEPR
ncbi:MAG: FecR domain-containing protein [Bacteroidota bacterium]